jgi:3-oxoacyl-[acyl-carrier protein] reductase
MDKETNIMTDQKVAIVTGGARGIGRAIAVELARAGYYLVINYKANDQAARETLEMIRTAGSDGEILKFDVREEAEVDAALQELFLRLKTIDVLVNNAGITADGLFIMMPREDWNSVIDTTLKGFYNMTKPVLKKMLRNKRGSIVSISSVAGLVANRGQANYSAAKAGPVWASG